MNKYRYKSKLQHRRAVRAQRNNQEVWYQTLIMWIIFGLIKNSVKLSTQFKNKNNDSNFAKKLKLIIIMNKSLN